MTAPPLRVLLEASALVDARRDAGIGRYVELLRDHLPRAGVEVQLALPSRPPRSESRPGRLLHAQAATAGAVRRWRPDLVHGVGGEPVPWWPHRRQVVTVHDTELWSGERPRGARGRVLAAYAHGLAAMVRRCAAVIVVSETVAVRAAAVLGVRPERIHVVPLALNDGVAAGRPGRGEVSPRHVDDGFVLWVGSLRHHDPRKELDVLVDAMAAVPGRPSLLLAGASGAESVRVLERAAHRGVQASHAGLVDQATLVSLYARAAAVVIPSRNEGFGLVALEAMTHGAPVVAAEGGNLPHLLGDAGLLVAPGDAAGLARAIARVLGDATLTRRMREAGRRRAAWFTPSRTAEMTLAVYRAVARPR